MPEGARIRDELKKLIGLPGEPQIFKVEEGASKRYAEAIDDPKPLYNDVEDASKSKYGRLICPPGFTGWPDKRAKILGIQVSEVLIAAGAPPRPLDGSIEFEFFIPIGAGDILVEITKITNITERDTKSGKALFAQVEYTFVNQNGAVALRCVATYIYL